MLLQFIFFKLLCLLLTDLVAVPNYIGAMENWGLVTFAENYLLYEPGITPEKDKQYAAMVIAHEISHQVYYYDITYVYVTVY